MRHYAAIKQTIQACMEVNKGLPNLWRENRQKSEGFVKFRDETYQLVNKRYFGKQLNFLSQQAKKQQAINGLKQIQLITGVTLPTTQ